MYNLLGFDILVTDEFNPKLLEVNHSPSMSIHDNLEKPIKNKLLVDTLNIIGISPFSRKKIALYIHYYSTKTIKKEI